MFFRSRAKYHPMWTSALFVMISIGPTGCHQTELDGRTKWIASQLVESDLPLIINRPELSEGKFRRMTEDVYTFFRGTFPLFLEDSEANTLGLGTSKYPLGGILTHTLGDAHPENFGTFWGADGQTPTLEPNDFDGTGLYPCILELRRLLVGMTLAIRESNQDNSTALAAALNQEEAILTAGVNAYVQAALARNTTGAVIAPISPANTQNKVIRNLFEKAQDGLEERGELIEYTQVINEERRFKRGRYGSTSDQLYSLAETHFESLRPALTEYKDSLFYGPDHPGFFELKDAVRVMGTGVTSWSRLRFFLLVEGPSAGLEDDVILEMKEISSSSAFQWFPPGLTTNTEAERIQIALHELWSSGGRDPFWSAVIWQGIPVQIRAESDAHKTIRVRKLNGSSGSVESLVGVAEALFKTLARMHDTDRNGLRAMAQVIGKDSDDFIQEQVQVARTYASVVEADFIRFQEAVQVLGLRLGVPLQTDMQPSPEQQLFIHGVP